jgi:hypothetical protein
MHSISVKTTNLRCVEWTEIESETLYSNIVQNVPSEVDWFLTIIVQMIVTKIHDIESRKPKI